MAEKHTAAEIKKLQDEYVRSGRLHQPSDKVVRMILDKSSEHFVEEIRAGRMRMPVLPGKED